MLGRKLSVEAMIDRKTVIDVVAKDDHTTERRLQIDVFAQRQSYDTGEIARISWIPGAQNPADSDEPGLISYIPPIPLDDVKRLHDLITRVGNVTR